MSESRIRINFQLPLNVLLELERVAAKAGITKSSLLRDWIVSTNTLHINQNDETDSVNKSQFNFFVDQELNSFISKRSNSLGLSVSSFLRAVIGENIKTGQTGIVALAPGGESSEIAPLIRSYNSMYLAGDLDGAANLIDQLKEKQKHTNDLTVKCTIGFLESAYLYLRRDITQSELLVRGNLENLKTITNRKLIANFYVLYAKIGFLQETIDQVISYLEQALLYLDPLNFPTEIADVYVNLGKAYTHTTEFSKAIDYFSRAEQILKQHKNRYVESVLYFEQGVMYYLLGDFGKAAVLNAKAYEIMKELSNNPDDLYRMININARILYHSDERDLSLPEFRKSLAFESRLSDSSKIFSSVSGFMGFIESKDNYRKSQDKLKRILAISPANFRASFRDYIVNSAKFVYSPSINEREQGRRGLKKLAKKANYKLLEKASENTLQTKKLQPIR